MNYIESNEIIKIFKFLNKNNIKYILIRNINNELPNSLKIFKDIDLLINYEDKIQVIDFLNRYSFKEVIHPHRNNTFLYGAKKFIFFKNTNNSIIFDLNFHLMCRSLNNGEWIPLDQTIQTSAWKNKRFEERDNNFSYWTLGYDDEFIALVVRSIFDKKEFQTGYIKRIEELKNTIDMNEIKKKMNFIFFKFTPYLLDMITKKNYENIIQYYLHFKEY